MLKNTLSTFIIFTILLLTLTLLVSHGFLSDAFEWNSRELSFKFFDRTFFFDKRIPIVTKQLISFNDIIFGSGFSDGIMRLSEFAFSLLHDIFTVCFGFAKKLVGA